MVLGELTVPLTRLSGVGPAALRDLAKLGVTDCGKLLQHFPRDHVNRKDEVTLRTALVSGVHVNTLVQVTDHDWFGPPSRRTLKLLIVDREGTQAEIPCYHRNFLEKIYPVGASGWLWGTVEIKFQHPQVSSFQLEPPPEGRTFGDPLEQVGKLEPLYPLAGHLTQTGLAKAVAQTFQLFVVGLEDDLPAILIEKYRIPPLRQLLWSAHFPENLEQRAQTYHHLAYRELFHLQTAVRRRPLSQAVSLRPGQTFSRRLQKELLLRLPFELTPDQDKVIDEIVTDLESDRPMGRLLQGDVGSGKTLVAFLSALPLIEAGYQCALMAPTELLALQHAENAGRLLDPLGVRVAYLTGNLRASGRNSVREALAEGNIDFVIGTHALFSTDIRFKNLRYVIIDEQHRFGVSQRQALAQKGQLPDLLLMSATPIPRTLALTAFGDLKTSVIRTMPLGRKPIVTHTAKQSNQTKVYEFVRHELQAGRQAYFVYPLIESSESLDLKDAETMVKYLAENIFPEFTVAMVHSRVDDDDKKRVMEEFSAGKIQVLVATSVVEVGVDVANATCMVIEHAERFGLSALHQLRGRVGRSTLASFCFLVYSENLTEVGKQRLKVMMSTTDGFQIAEEDLKLRGPGDLTGVRQSGYLKLRTADLARDFELLVQARDDVEAVFLADPGLLTVGNSGVRRLWEKAPPFSDDLVAL
ncbi:MAG: ATP-dependent DNA helicase RecG [Spirochaetales bacterium]|nr:ATP-dependent DNA helicase RecG [Spirochaetales bacterium]